MEILKIHGNKSRFAILFIYLLVKPKQLNARCPISTTTKLTTELQSGYLGCYNDASNRDLDAKDGFFYRSLNYETCKSFCSSYKYMGLQNR
jgi:hypothetical protein